MIAVVITSIHPPTAAVARFALMEGHRLIVVADRRTPVGWSHPGTEFLAIDDQHDVDAGLAAALPENHYSRKMLGYVRAIHHGAPAIVDTDDDNLPIPGYSFPNPAGEFDSTARDLGFVNPYAYFTDQRIWPRGFPLDQVIRCTEATPLDRRPCRVGIWQGLADADPDVDAVYRLTDGAPCRFRPRAPVVLAPGTVAPFNSQNTWFSQASFPLLFLPTTVSFRFTDILRGLVAQPVLWHAGLDVGFSAATVVQDRNPHDLMADFVSEMPMYQHGRRALAIAAGAVRAARTIPDNLLAVYAALADAGIVQPQELVVLRAWLTAIGTGPREVPGTR